MDGMPAGHSCVEHKTDPMLSLYREPRREGSARIHLGLVLPDVTAPGHYVALPSAPFSRAYQNATASARAECVAYLCMMEDC